VIIKGGIISPIDVEWDALIASEEPLLGQKLLHSARRTLLKINWQSAPSALVQ
jgi:hypothetical protein